VGPLRGGLAMEEYVFCETEQRFLLLFLEKEEFYSVVAVGGSP
jgi:hypothetical protein